MNDSHICYSESSILTNPCEEGEEGEEEKVNEQCNFKYENGIEKLFDAPISSDFQNSINFQWFGV